MNKNKSLAVVFLSLLGATAQSHAYTVTSAGGNAFTTKTITNEATGFYSGDSLAINQSNDASPVFADGDTIEITLSGGATFADSAYSLEGDIGGAGIGDITTATLLTASPQGKSSISFRLDQNVTATCGDNMTPPCLAEFTGFILSTNIAGQVTNFNLPQINGQDIYITFTVKDSMSATKGTVQQVLFDNTLPPGPTAEETKATVKNVLASHIRNITAQGAGLSGLMTGHGFNGTNVSGLLGEAAPLSSLIAANEFHLPMALMLSEGSGSFAYSLNTIADQNKTQHATNSFSKDSELKSSPYNLWVKGRWTGITDTRGGTKGDGDFGLVMMGADYRYSKDTLLGMMLQVDLYDQTSTGLAAKGKGNGWLIGPYMVTRLDEELIWDARFAMGQSSHEINISDSGWDKYDGSRLQIETNLTGQFEYKGWDILPQIGLQYFEEKQKAFTTSNGTTIDAQKVAVGNLTFGPELSKNWMEETGNDFRTLLALKGVWDFKSPDIVHSNGSTVSTEELRARAELGVDINLSENSNLYAKYAYDGIGLSGYEAQSIEVASNMPANFGFLPIGSQLKSSFSHSLGSSRSDQVTFNLVVPLQ